MLDDSGAQDVMVRSTGRAAEKPRCTYVLIVDEDAAVRNACCEIATRLGYRPHGFDDLPAAHSENARSSADIMLLGLKELSGVGLELLREVKVRHPETAIVVMSAFATIPSAIEAMRSGATDLLTKPFTSDELATVLERSAERRALTLANRRLRDRFRSHQGMGGIIGRSPQMEKLYRILYKVSQSNRAALILGESGTGKELVARFIHDHGGTSGKPFIPIDCGSLVPTLIESELFGHVKGAFTGANFAKDGLLVSAGKGTVFLDEIGELPLDLQARLLRALQEREVRPVGGTHTVPIQARVLAATNRDLASLVKHERFRKDLYYRLNVVNLRIPPLRERRGDIPLLVNHILERLTRETGRDYTLSEEALRMMVEYPWPGNVRELEHAIQRGTTVSSGPLLQLGDLPSQIVDFAMHQPRTARCWSISVKNRSGRAGGYSSDASGMTGIIPLAAQEKEAILSTLDILKGDKLMAAKVLGIGKTTLYRKLKEYDIDDRPATGRSDPQVRGSSVVALN